MMNMSDLAARELQWVQPSAKKQFYELHTNQQTVCTLHMEGSFNARATAVNSDGSWDFDRKGFWQRHVTIRKTGSAEDLAVYNANSWRQGGTLTMPFGRSYLFKFNFWNTQFFVTTENDQALISITKIRGFIHYSGNLEIHSLARHLPELPWLVPLSWYLIMMQQRDTAAAAAA